MIGIYKFENKINHQIYIGQSRNIQQRYKDHLTRAYNNFKANTEFNSVIHQAIRKYGIENFTFDILEECSIEELNDKEKYWIAYYDSFKHGYNCTSGGEQQEPARKFDDNFIIQMQQLLIDNQLTYNEIHNQYHISIGRLSEINTGKVGFSKNLSYPLRSLKKERHCKRCGQVITAKYAQYCQTCYRIERNNIVNRPSRAQLKEMIRTMPFTQIGKQYKVSDNAIRKWCKVENLPTTKKEIKSYTDEEWALL